MGRTHRALMFVAFTVLAVPSVVWSQARDHDGGFFLRMLLGGGSAGSKNDAVGLDFSGAGLVFDVSVGAIVIDNLALHGTFFGWSISDPDVDVSGLGSTTASGTLDMSAFGAGATYFFMPINLYLSGNIGAGTLSGDGDIDGESDTGLAMNFLVGKEWWVSNRWALGLAGSVGYHSLPEPTVNDEKWSGTNFSLLFSTTFN